MDKDAYIIQLEEENRSLKQRLAQCEQLIADLMRRLGLNSTNSSKPPASEGLAKPPRTQSTRAKGKKPSGGQRGHTGHTLEQVSVPDYLSVHDVSFCSACGLSLEDKNVHHTLKRQVFDIPEPKIEVTEHQATTKICTCGHVNVAAFPMEATAPTCYGKRIQSVSTYLSNQHFIPEDRLQDVFKDLFSVSISTGSIATFNARLAKAVTPYQEQVLEALKKSAVKHLDETGFRVGGKTQWLHVISTETQTHYRVSEKRKDLKPLEGASGIVVHDHWKSYFKLQDVEHSLCNAHHLRELKAIMEIEKERWAFQMDRLLRCLNRSRDCCFARASKLYDQIIKTGIAFHESLPPFEVGKRKRRVGHNLLIRLRDFKEDVLRFLNIPGVPFTNNQAEQDVRMMKVKQKISGGFRTSDGANNFAIIRGFISTKRKQNMNISNSPGTP
jgi:transposase